MMALAFAAPRVSGFLPQVSAVHGMAFRTTRTVLYPSLIIFWHVFFFKILFLKFSFLPNYVFLFVGFEPFETYSMTCTQAGLMHGRYIR